MWLILLEIPDLRISETDKGVQVIEAIILDLLVDLTARLAGTLISPDLRVDHSRAISRAHHVISKNLWNPSFDSVTLAKTLRMSNRKVASLFSQLGTTVNRYILDSRLELAADALRDPVNLKRQISDISLSCGIEDANYFARCFRAKYSTTPRDFRKEKGIRC